MTYCTKQNMIDRFSEAEVVQLTDAAGVGVIDDTVLGRAIADAASQIDAKIRGLYTLPISPAPTELVPVACDIARYLLHKDAAPELVISRYNAALKFLRDLATGIATLSTEAQKPAGPVVVATAGVFNDDLLGMMP
jgi:phage gp36-like protein